MTLSNTVLNPVPSTDWVNTICNTCGDKVVVTFTATNTFNLQPNDPYDGVTSWYSFAMGANGQYTACVSSLTCTTIVNPVNDETQMRGSGIFVTGGSSVPIDYAHGPGDPSNTDCTSSSSPSTWPFCPGTKMYFKVGGTTSSATTISLQQTNNNPNPPNQPGYPHYKCQNNWATSPATITDPITNISATYSKTKCTPTITQIYIFKVFGPDSLSLWTSIDGVGEGCGNPGGPTCDCSKSPEKCSDNAITTVLGAQHARSNTATAGIDPATACTPDTKCNGTIIVKLTTSPDAQPSGCGLPPDQPCNTFNYNFDGPDVHAFTITTEPTTGLGQSDPFTQVFTGLEGHARVLTAGIEPPFNAQGDKWQIDGFQVTSPNGTLIQGIDYDLIPGAMEINLA
jgi:hypothetical protein